MVLPYIIQPTRMTFHSKSIIDNIFSNCISQDIISGNLTSTISDHLPQFLIALQIFSNVPNKKSNIFEHDLSKFNREECILDYFAIDWPHILKLQNNDTNTSFQNFFDYINRILDKHAPLKKLSKCKLKFKTKTWITMALQKSTSIKNKLFSDYINKKDQKTELHIKYKSYRNMLSTLMKKIKQNYFITFFENNLKNLKNTWKGIKSIISMKSSFLNTPTLLTFQNENIDNPERIANIFNNYFSTIGEETQAKIKHSHKKYTDYLSNENTDTFFLSPTNKKEIKFILSSLDINKSTGPYSIPSKVLNMLKNNDISEQLADMFNLSFKTATFSTLLKTAEVISIHKKDSKLNLTNYRPISLLSNLEKILEKLMHSRLSTFLNIKDIIYPLHLGFRQNYSTSYALIHLTETIKEALDQGKYGCGSFVDLQKPFDAVNHNILLGKLKHYGIRGVAYS